MSESCMKKIVYNNMPTYDSPEDYREYVAKSCEYSCVYCTLTESESSGATFNIDHFRPQKLFPKLYSECSNLRYSCPRCNSYKRARWIAQEYGCIRDCESCKKKVCKSDIPRFIDGFEENPEDFLIINSEYIIVPKNNSKVGKYTIDSLRLNRAQLVKIRKIRAFINEWEDEMDGLLYVIDEKQRVLKDKKERINQIKRTIDASEREEILLNIIVLNLESFAEELGLERDRIAREKSKISYIQANLRESDKNYKAYSDVN